MSAGVRLALLALALFSGCVREEPVDVSPAARLDPVEAGATLREVFESLPDGGRSELRVLDRNTDAWVERWRLLGSARTSIDVAYFILDQDVFGASFLGHLLERARAGVRIRVLLDSFGTDMSRSFRGNDYLDALANTANVAIKMFRPLHERTLEGLLRLSVPVALASEHDKIIVVDEERTLVGGRNIATDYFVEPEEHEENKPIFFDTDVRIDGREIARAARAAFDLEYGGERSDAVERDLVNLEAHEIDLALAYRAMDLWLSGKEPPEELVRELEERGLPWGEDLRRYRSLRGALGRPRQPGIVAETRLVDSPVRFGSSGDPVTRMLVRLVRAAREEIFGQSPYLVLSEDGVKVLSEAGRRGVRTTLLTNSPVSTDNALSQAFFLEQWPTILATVPNLRLFVGGTEHTLHGKLASFDRQVGVVGTYNLDPTSMTINGELAVAVWSEEFAGRMTATPRRRVERGPPATFQYRIRRDESGAPVLDDAGDPTVEFGPRDHTSPDHWKEVSAYWAVLRGVTAIPGLSPFL